MSAPSFARVDREDRLEGLGGARVIEELLVVEARDALVEVDLLARRRRDLDLTLEDLEQLAVLAVAVEDAVEALQRVEVRGIDGEHGLEAARGLGEIVQVVLVDLGDLREGLGLLDAATRLGATLEDLRERLEVAGALRDARHGLAGAGVARIVREDGREEVAGAREVVEPRLEQLGGLGAEIARLGRGGGGVGAGHEETDELRPLLRAAVDRASCPRRRPRSPDRRARTCW